MITSEAELIQGYFAPLAKGEAGAFALKDDAAALAPEPGRDLVLTMDAIAAGVHFFPDDAPADIGWKALAVNVSDLIAKGARPRAYLMSVAFPEAPADAWLKGFSAGLSRAQRAFGITLIGGDTDRRPGPLSVTITAIGQVPHGRMVKRSGARAGDRILVSGTLGDAALGLKLRGGGAPLWRLSSEHAAFLERRYLRPEPRVGLVPLLAEFAMAGMDISDGLIKDLGRMAAASGVGARLRADQLPLSTAGRAVVAHDSHAIEIVVGGGDDYEVLAAVGPDCVPSFIAAAADVGVPLTEIGSFEAGCGVTLLDASGHRLEITKLGYDHF